MQRISRFCIKPQFIFAASSKQAFAQQHLSRAATFKVSCAALSNNNFLNNNSIKRHYALRNTDNEEYLEEPDEEIMSLSFDEQHLNDQGGSGTTASAVITHARKLAQEGQIDKAIQLLTRHIDVEKKMHQTVENPSEDDVKHNKKTLATLFNNLGVLCENKQRFDMATKAFMESMALNPNDAAVYGNLGVIFHRTGRLEAAISMYKKALHYDNTLLMTRYRLGRCYLEQENNFQDAKKVFLECISLDPKFLRPYADLATTLCQMHPEDDKQLALKLSEDLLKIAPNDPISIHTRSFVLIKLGRTSEASLLLEQAQAMFPDDIDFLLNIAVVKEQTGDKKGALAMVHRAFELDDTNPDTLFLLARLLDANGRTSEAEHILTQMLQAQPENLMFYVALMNIWIDKGKFDAAFAMLDEASRKYPKIKEDLTIYKQYVVAKKSEAMHGGSSSSGHPKF